jgi:hypothetical protein
LPYLKYKADNHKCTCISAIPYAPCALKKYIEILQGIECECIINSTHENRIGKVRAEKDWQRQDINAHYIPCYTETLYIYSPHAYGYITLNELSIVHLNKGYNCLCLCGYNALRGNCNDTQRDCIVLTLQPGLFMRLVEYKSHDFRISIFVLYNTFHTCEKPPLNQDPVPSLKHLSTVSMMAAGTFTLSDKFLRYAEQNLPRTVGDDLPAFTTINTIISTHFYSVSEDNYDNTCTVRLCENEDHKVSRLLKNRLEPLETEV